MDEWKSIGPDSMLKDGSMAEIDVAGKRMLLARVEGNYYATELLCAHMKGNLSRGKLNGFVVTCPWHGSQYDVRDGHNIKWAPKMPSPLREATEIVRHPRGLHTYATKVEEGQVWVNPVETDGA